MASFEKIGAGNFSTVLNQLEKYILESGVSVKLESKSNYKTKDTNVAIRIFERYSFLGGNRLSMSVVLVESDNKLFLNITTAGGSQAIFFKVNRFGENSFLNSIKDFANKLIK